MDEEIVTTGEKNLYNFGAQSEGEMFSSLYRIDFKKHPVHQFKDALPVSNETVPQTTVTSSPVNKKCLSYQQISSLAKTDNSRNSTGYMNNISEYKRSYFKQHNVENSLPRLHKHVEESLNNFKDFAHMPKPQLVKAPFAAMSIDSMPLLTKKKLLEKYYASDKTYYMDDILLYVKKEHLQVKTLEDVHYEKENLFLKNPTYDLHTTDQIEIIAPLFYKHHSDIKQICGLQAEILKLSNRARQNAIKKQIEKKEDEITKKIERNNELKKEFKLRIPFKKDYGFTGCYPQEATHSEVLSSTKYPSFLTMNALVHEQYRRRIFLENFNKDILKHRVECFNPKKVPLCFDMNKLSM